MMRNSNCLVATLLMLAPACVEAKPPAIGTLAPAFRVTSFDGREVSLADLRGKVVVLNFWATWCGPCRKELPLLDAYSKIQQQHGLEVVAVTTEDSLPLYRLKPLAAMVSFTMARRFRGDYGAVSAVPMNFVIDRSGILRYAKAGSFDLDSLNETLVPLLKAAE